MPAESILAGISQEATQTELLGNITLLLSAMLEKMPRVTGFDQCAVAIETGNVNVTAISQGAYLTNLVNIGGKQASQMPDAISQMGALHLYQNILVSA